MFLKLFYFRRYFAFIIFRLVVLVALRQIWNSSGRKAWFISLAAHFIRLTLRLNYIEVMLAAPCPCGSYFIYSSFLFCLNAQSVSLGRRIKFSFFLWSLHKVYNMDETFTSWFFFIKTFLLTSYFSFRPNASSSFIVPSFIMPFTFRPPHHDPWPSLFPTSPS